jgi:hypothetical protein
MPYLVTALTHDGQAKCDVLGLLCSDLICSRSQHEGARGFGGWSPAWA